MNNQLYPFLKYTAIIAAIAWIGWSFYDYLGSKNPGDFAYHAGTNYFADGHYTKALNEYEQALTEAEGHIPAKRGRAEALIMLGREREAIAAYQELVQLQPDHAGHHANMGIAYDRLGQPGEALLHYEKALSMDDTAATEGPSWLTRFLRNQAEKPPGIVERVSYLKSQLALPEKDRILQIPSIDSEQRPYKK